MNSTYLGITIGQLLMCVGISGAFFSIVYAIYHKLYSVLIFTAYSMAGLGALLSFTFLFCCGLGLEPFFLKDIGNLMIVLGFSGAVLSLISMAL